MQETDQDYWDWDQGQDPRNLENLTLDELREQRDLCTPQAYFAGTFEVPDGVETPGDAEQWAWDNGIAPAGWQPRCVQLGPVQVDGQEILVAGFEMFTPGDPERLAKLEQRIYDIEHPNTFEFTDTTEGFTRTWSPRARQVLTRFAEDSGPTSAFGQHGLTTASRWLSLPEDDPSRQAYEDGLTDRLGFGGLGWYWTDHSGQTNLDRYVANARTRAPGTVHNTDQAAQLVAELMAQARRDGVRFRSSNDASAFAAELASAVFSSIGQPQAPKAAPKRKNQKHTPYATPAAARADHTGTLDRFLAKDTDKTDKL